MYANLCALVMIVKSRLQTSFEGSEVEEEDRFSCLGEVLR